VWILLSASAAAAWLALLIVPWRPWSTRERLEPTAEDCLPSDLRDVTVLIPARNEAALIERSVRAAAAQGEGLRIMVIDDQSTDATADVARRAGAHEVIASAALPEDWTGKLWALEQGRRRARTPLVLLLDADIALAPGAVRALRRRMSECAAQLASVMAAPRLASFWERLLLPAFVYFFKLLYPFRLANEPSMRVAAAAGGCVLLERRVLEDIGGFAALRGALIDDCTLARLAKRAGFATWIGLTHAASSARPSPRLADVWNMVARTAFTQLRYSTAWLLACTAIMALVFGVPVAALVAAAGTARIAAAVACAALCASYVPTLRYYGLHPLRALTLPPVAALFLAMTWSSALRYWRGTRSAWRGRTYARTGNPAPMTRVD
jgi:hopene-associated glycosyltransferase HpnB